MVVLSPFPRRSRLGDEREKGMADRTIAWVTGILFIVASAAAIVGGGLLLPIGKDDYLTKVADAEGQVVSGALIELVLVLAVIAIAVMLFPVLRRHDEGLALSYVGARTIEGVLLLAASLSALFVLSLSKDYGARGAAGTDPVGESLLSVRDWTYLIGSLVIFGVGALILYSLLYRTMLVPRWLSWWGLIGAALVLARGLVEMYGVEFSGLVQGLLAAPIGINEMVLAVWLIVKGFDPGAIARLAPADVAADSATAPPAMVG
jgi:hypothetical protein